MRRGRAYVRTPGVREGIRRALAAVQVGRESALPRIRWRGDRRRRVVVLGRRHGGRGRGHRSGIR
jgi:hypothetical protein